MTPTTSDADIRTTLMALVEARGPDRSICPSDVARALADEATWRSLMGPIRVAAAALMREGRIEILKKGKPVDPNSFRGVIRLRVARTPDQAEGVPL